MREIEGMKDEDSSSEEEARGALVDDLVLPDGFGKGQEEVYGGGCMRKGAFLGWRNAKG